VSGRPPGGGHWPDLDGLRALAITLVVARHSLRPFISEDAYAPVASAGGLDLTPLLLNGWVGVDLFFVLSGFLVGRQALRGTEGLGWFWFRRAARILPAYWACLLVVGVGLSLGRAWPRAALDFAAHLAMLQDYTGSVFVPALWSLAVEEKFYLLVPPLVLLLRRRASPLGQMAGLAVLWALPVAARAVLASQQASAMSYESYFETYRSPFHLTCESLMLGVAIAWVHERGGLARLPRRAREVLFWAGAAGVAAWVVPSVILRPIDVPTIVWASMSIGLGFGAMVLAAVAGPGSYSALLGRASARPLASGSYALYLTHMLVMPVALGLSATFPVGASVTLTARWLRFVPWYLALSCASAWLLWRFVERPALAWRDRVLRRSAVRTGTLQMLPSA
jgi:peptidoglycan/LPS O-acetylase OafA/YrhL